MNHRILFGLCLSLLASPLAAQGSQDGDRPEYTFREVPFNGRGVTSLNDLRGKPILIDFWGTR